MGPLEVGGLLPAEVELTAQEGAACVQHIEHTGFRPTHSRLLGPLTDHGLAPCLHLWVAETPSQGRSR